MTHLVLVGLMGAGKSSVGRRLAERLERPFVDVDDLVEAAAARTIAEIFATEGETGFRTRERDALVTACASSDPSVIACGGGAMGDARNRATVRAAGRVVWLTADPATLAARVEREEEGQEAPTRRPLLEGGTPLATLERLAAQRAAGYHDAAHVVVDTEGRSVDQVVALVSSEVARCNG